MSKPKVSVCMIVYNHEKYIEEAIRGVLIQQTNFDIEFILANDASKDKTHEIICKLAIDTEKISFKYFNHKENLGMIPNFVFALKECTGKYIALCEGDDYWTDPLKLQKQVDYMEVNLDYSICFHRVKLLMDNKLIPDISIEKRYNKIEKLPASINDLLEKGNFIHTPSVLFRNQLTQFPIEFANSTVGDYFLYIILAQKGFVKRLDDCMAVYRTNVGIYSTLSNSQMFKSITIYNSCILSYLVDPEQKKILLERQISIINNINIDKADNLMTIEKLSNRLGITEIFKILMYKIKSKF
jgi:glycosyltransferase involved in cell wall biosynthesis